MKSTAQAPSNIAFIKYWGKKDELLRIPENGSISMNLSGLLTTTTVEFSPAYDTDIVEINGEKESNEEGRVVQHLNRIRALAKIDFHAKVVSKNNFPIGTGLSSSGSGFAALTVAATDAAGLRLNEKELSVLARQGSGSACRSIPDGFVEWVEGEASEESYAQSLYPPDYWDLADVVAIVSEERKDIATSEGQKLINTSPFFQIRRKLINEKLDKTKKILAEKNFRVFGEVIEAEALELHAIMLTSHPSLIYWTSGTLLIMKWVKQWRKEGVPVYFTINTGQNIHLICKKETVNIVKEKLSALKEVKDIIVNFPAEGSKLINAHLF